MRDVHEVAVLRFPEHEVPLRRRAEAVFETHDGRFGERAVVDLESSRGQGNVGERRVRATRLHVMQHRIAMREGTALGILPAQPHAHAAEQQGAEGKRLGVTPIDESLV